jgi:hypothetical protein
METKIKRLQGVGVIAVMILGGSLVAVGQQSSDSGTATDERGSAEANHIGAPPLCCAGTAGSIVQYKTSTSLANSNIFQSTSGATNGYIGIGTATPATNLQIVGQANTNLTVESSVPNGNPTISVIANTPAGAAQLSLSRADGGAPAIIYFQTAGTTDWLVAVPDGNTGELDFKNTPGNIALALLQDGQVGIGTNTPSNLLTLVEGGGPALADGWSTYSSSRFKTNIQPLEGSLEKVEEMRGVSYQRRSDGKHEIGVIAEEVDKIVPEVVSHDPSTRQAQGVDYSRITALLIEAVKEQQAEIEQLRAKVQQLTPR